ncbi:hypothetical protein AB0912_06665 [Streptomyces sp. NPDC007084]|uniref:hypothetical protein n=1 Tax=Streptomyces sp. NPDC007084 TaxID=3154313 RepID=UPI0034570222
MTAQAHDTDRQAEPGRPPDPLRWVIWHTATETILFDRDLNGPLWIEDEAELPEILGRMRAAGVPESFDYPGRPCS